MFPNMIWIAWLITDFCGCVFYHQMGTNSNSQELPKYESLLSGSRYLLAVSQRLNGVVITHHSICAAYMHKCPIWFLTAFSLNKGLTSAKDAIRLQKP